MLITPLQLLKEPLTLDAELPAGTIDYTEDIQQAGPLALTGQAELLVEDRGRGEIVNDIRLRGHFAGEFAQLCARCLEPVPVHVDDTFDLIFRPAGTDVSAGERAITEEETEIGYYEPSGLLLEDALREQVLLTLPARALCSEDCQGVQSADRAIRRLAEDAGPAETPADPRWSALAGLQLKN